ncbi:MAG: DUF3418 domain-containing protein, partial [Pseudomonadota bacterium]
WKSIELDPCLMMNFQIVDNDQKLIEEGRDFDALKQALEEDTNKAISGLEKNLSLKQEAITQWSFDDLKPIKHDMGDHFVLAFPTLIYKNNEIQLTVTHDEDLSKRLNRRALRALMLLQIPHTVKYLQKNIPKMHDIAMLGADIATRNALIEQVLLAAAGHLIDGGNIQTKADFTNKIQSVESGLTSAVNSLAELLYQVLKTLKSCQRLLRTCKNLQLMKSVNDMQAQIQSLFFDGFLESIAFEKLENYPRFLKAIEIRIERMDLNPAKEQLSLKEIQPWQEELEKMQGIQSDRAAWPEAWTELRWMIEEFRVSLFAQGVKTEFPISAKRLNKQLEKINAMS